MVVNMNIRKITAFILSAALSVTSLGLTALAEVSSKVEAEAEGVSVFNIPTSDNNNNSKIIKNSTSVTYYINPNQTPRATIFKLSPIEAGETALARINFQSLYVSNDDVKLEYCLFTAGSDITLDSTVQDTVKEELYKYVTDDDIVTKTVNNKNELNWDLPSVQADTTGYVYLYIGCGNLTEAGLVSTYKRQWVIDSFDVSIYEDGETVPSAPPAQTETPASTPKPTQTAAPSQPTAAPTATPVPVDGFTVDSVYTDNMVFQRGETMTITGTGKSGDTISVAFNGETADTVVEHGAWEVILPTMGVVKSADMTITNGDESTVLTNVAVGDVILCSGQSNMDYTFNSWGGLRQTEPTEDLESVRLLTSDGTDNGGWKVATTENSIPFSALGYMIGKRLSAQEPDVPIGLVKAAYGGSGIVQWVPSYAANWNPQAKRMMAGSNKKGDLYTSRLLPVKNFKYSAAVWYQGEANTSYDKGTEYETMMISLINNWRNVLEDGDLPFIIIQLPTANFSTIYAPERIGTGVRAAQWNVSERLENVETVVSIDTGATNNVHPSDKQPIADRAAAFIRDYINGTESDIKSPSFDYMERSGDTLVLHFKNTYGSLKTDDGSAPVGFELKGADGTYSDAVPVINGDTLEFDVTGIDDPQVRYAWNDTPGISEEQIAAAPNKNVEAAANLFNASDRPMAPFKTDAEEKYAYKDLSLKTDCYEYSPYILKTEQDGQDVVVKAYDVDGVVEDVQVYIDEEFAGNAEKQGDEWRFTPETEPGVHTVYAVATDNDGHISTECVDYANYNLVRPARYDFVSGGYSVDKNRVEYNNGDELISKAETNADGTDLVAEAAVPYGEVTTSVKLEATSPNKTVSMSVPVSDAENIQKKITIEYDTKFERQDDTVRAARGMYAVTKSGKELQLIYFTKTSLRAAVYGMFYETAIDVKSDMWHHIKMEIYPNAGTFSLWLDDVMRYDNVSFINEAKDFEKNKGGFDVLKEGITELKFYHTSASDNGGMKNATYIDNVVFDEEAFTTGKPDPTASFVPVNWGVENNDEYTADGNKITHVETNSTFFGYKTEFTLDSSDTFSSINIYDANGEKKTEYDSSTITTDGSAIFYIIANKNADGFKAVLK